ncbi:hypothetical protein HMPREF1565_0218 [Providencia alcalifaciens RIMD 1656011]|uniref:Uncharacterized protein n=2 Tax=Providencia alcalifaciens TaxID=126385 RepID=B6XEB1_9GAMM|nr:hypothetical protein PROVALCAL_01689 [Providencia alcalifaciens DSM 30120]ETT06477.1 hypothetical protein HMPREF1562_0835 [Providencia alcalifaciens F90-2004]EUC93953.1 hypothetical protein HMPREF1567_0489 [Providencia alcalifaciens PAL-2]EUD03332.1 hypothetical protein HMPREF1565_0218 [Providencia alcalifaciens RIMD 1656011]EUD07176.1 hypothetical protein HMPREF1564_0669 [Providencia alcalifaciens R90-1475]EUD09298.1 hypothetical protein HMPREF1563_3409 [Providencia alcalifaciens 205/92]
MLGFGIVASFNILYNQKYYRLNSKTIHVKEKIAGCIDCTTAISL